MGDLENCFLGTDIGRSFATDDSLNDAIKVEWMAAADIGVQEFDFVGQYGFTPAC